MPTQNLPETLKISDMRSILLFFLLLATINKIS